MRLRSFCAAAAHAPMTTVATASTRSGVRSLRDLVAEERERDAEETVDAHLRHGAGEQHGDWRWGFSVGGGQPGVERDQGHLDREAGEDADGEPDAVTRAEVRGDHLFERAGGGELREVAEVHAAGGEEDGEEREEQGHGADHGVDEELRGCRAAARAAPELDEEEGGDEAEFPEQEPVEEVERGEGTEEAGLEDEDEAEVEIGLMVDAVGCIDRHEGDDGGEHEHERAEAVDAEVILDAERGSPGYALDHAHGAVGGQAGPDEESERRGLRWLVKRATARACLPEKSATAAPARGSTVRSVRIGNGRS